MKICIYGAGAIGGWLAGTLADAGEEVSVVARGAHLAAIRRDGLTVEMPQKTTTTRPRASDDPAELGPQDAVVVTVKAPSLPSVAGGIGALLGPETRVAFLTNGIPWWYFQGHGGALDDRRLPLLDPGDVLRQAVPKGRVIGGIAWPASSVPAPGVIRMISAGTRGIVLGAPDGVTTPAIAALAAAFAKAGVGVDVSTAIRDLIWEKLAFNLSAGPMCVLTEAPVRDTHVEAACILASRAVLAEAAALIAAMGRVVALDVEKIVAANLQLGHRPSILQDLMAGRQMEIDALYGVPLELARMQQVATPVLDLLVAMIKVRARGAGLYGG